VCEENIGEFGVETWSLSHLVYYRFRLQSNIN
jgi:hypothetical protein